MKQVIYAGKRLVRFITGGSGKWFGGSHEFWETIYGLQKKMQVPDKLSSWEVGVKTEEGGGYEKSFRFPEEC